MTKSNILVLFILLLSGFMLVYAAQQESLPPSLKDAAVRDAACTKSTDSKDIDPTLTETPIRSGGREVGTIIEVQSACHCQEANCDNLVYLHNGQGYRLALHEKYVSLHPMKIVKLGMPSLTGQFEVSAKKMETTVYDWDGKDYRPSLCATVIKGSRVPAITRHPCKVAAQ